MAKVKPRSQGSAGRPAKQASVKPPKRAQGKAHASASPRSAATAKTPRNTLTKPARKTSTPAKAAAPKSAPAHAKPAKTAKPAKPPKAAKTVKGKGKQAQKLRYANKQQVVYPLHGVGQIIKIEERPFLDRKLLYYIIYIEVSDMTVMVPVDKADSLGIRPIVDRKESQKALKLVSDTYEPVPTDWKMRYQMNLDLLKSGSIIDIATVVRTLYHRSKIKELPILERKLFDSALRLLIDEVSLSLDKGKEEVERMVFERLESSRGK
jgi:CarD family transcriptional regulator